MKKTRRWFLRRNTRRVHSESGALRIGTTRGLTARLLPRLPGSFRSIHRDVQITLFEGTYDDVSSWLIHHRVDVGFTSLPKENLNAVGLVRDRFQLLVPRDHIFAQETSVTLEQIRDEPYIQMRADGSAQVIQEAFTQQGMTRTVQYELSDTIAILEMVQ